ncbi:alpha-2-HS-glycoprotein-like isoform X2 [Conger conger]|uniref:alpha-2-HS-glycoprotein-like isoform X2 n=1 Tax=Conger conger TaxID=82655 RepID=UPI002A5A358F|nr:alpha-2-HS-glycoprotein-like isoform X2 [Conger conger]
MRPVGTVVILGLLAGAWAQGLPSIRKPNCDSPEAEEAALAAQEYINAQLSHGYKYALNQVEEIKIMTKPDGGETFVVELDLLETKCHVLDPTPVANCTVRPRHETKVEADCDVVLSKAGGILTVVAYKCKSEPDSAEDVCIGCPQLVPLNHTDALQVVSASLAVFNGKLDNNSVQFALLEVGRLSAQVVSGGFQYFVEYGIVETNCPIDGNDACVPLPQPLGRKGFCVANGILSAVTVDCMLFLTAPPLDPTANGMGPVTPPAVPKLQTIPGLKHHHRFNAIRDPAAAGLLSESGESDEVPIVKRQAPMDTLLDLPVVPMAPEVPAAAMPLLPICPGRIRHF